MKIRTERERLLNFKAPSLLRTTVKRQNEQQEKWAMKEQIKIPPPPKWHPWYKKIIFLADYGYLLMFLTWNGQRLDRIDVLESKYVNITKSLKTNRDWSKFHCRVWPLKLFKVPHVRCPVRRSAVGVWVCGGGGGGAHKVLYRYYSYLESNIGHLKFYISVEPSARMHFRQLKT